jgi:hypothetical protein
VGSLIPINDQGKKIGEKNSSTSHFFFFEEEQSTSHAGALVEAERTMLEQIARERAA